MPPSTGISSSHTVDDDTQHTITKNEQTCSKIGENVKQMKLNIEELKSNIDDTSNCLLQKMTIILEAQLQQSEVIENLQSVNRPIGIQGGNKTMASDATNQHNGAEIPQAASGTSQSSSKRGTTIRKLLTHGTHTQQHHKEILGKAARGTEMPSREQKQMTI